MKKYLVIFLCFISSVFCFAEDFTFNGVPFGSKKGSFNEVTEIKIEQLLFKKIKYTYEKDVLIEVEAELKGGNKAMKILADFIDVMKKKHNMTSTTYLQSGGDIINLCDPNNNIISVIICEVDNEDGDAQLNKGKIYFTSNFCKHFSLLKSF